MSIGQAERVPLNEPTYVRVKKAIIGDLVSGAFSPGMHLTIEALTSRYEVSHMPIREALRQLEGEGMVVSLAHRGFKIEAITEAYIRNIYDIRVGVESMLGRRAAENVTDEELVTFRKLHDEFADLIRTTAGAPASLANISFHRRLYREARNPEAESMLEGRTRVVRTVADSLGGYLPEAIEDVIREHEQIIVAFENRDPLAAGEAVFDHVTAARDRLILRVRRSGAFGDQWIDGAPG